ncbi:MAG: hypothetical protein ACQUHE_11730 [Bacteroidia bacterium]
MRKYLFTIFTTLSLVFAFCTNSNAQFNFYKFSVGLGGGFTLPFADTKKAEYSLATQITTDYYFTPYLNTGLELQLGNMRGGDAGQGNFTNSFKLMSWNARMQLGQFYDRYDKLNKITSIIRGLYMGIGLGIIRSDVEAYSAYPEVPDVKGINHDLIFPVNMGGNVYFKDMYGRDRLELNFNFQLVVPMEDTLDGNLNPYSNFNDLYNFASIGFRYKFGVLGLDKRKNKLH